LQLADSILKLQWLCFMRGTDLLLEVYQNPLVDGPRAVYADWLLEQGHPLGDFISLQLARAAGKRGNPKKEQQILATHGARALWPEHPLVAGESDDFTPQWLDTARGFPIAFNPTRFMRGGLIGNDFIATTTQLLKLTGHAGWGTVERFNTWHQDPAEQVAKILLQSPMLALTELTGLSAEMLAIVAGAPLPVRTLELILQSGEKIPAVRGFPNLHALTLHFVNGACTLENAIAFGRQTQLLVRIDELRLRGIVSPGLLAAPLAAFESLPKRITSMALEHYANHDSNARTTLRREANGPTRVELVVTRHNIEALANELRGFAQSTVHIQVNFLDFWNGGGFTKTNRSRFQGVLIEAARHLPHVSLRLDK
jgi:uncharacterized protein (TIGR02996 family)